MKQHGRYGRINFLPHWQPIVFVLLFLAGIGVCAGTVKAEEKVVKNSFGMEFVPIPSGFFLMGAADTESGVGRNEKPRHPVTISKAFYLGQYEVTQKQWEMVMGNKVFSMPRSYPGRWDSLINQPGRFAANEKPATVSWNDAQAFISRLNKIEDHHRYRLPTEAEWEYACRAGTTTAYSFGDDTRQLGRYAWHGEDFATGSIHPVGKKEPNSWGLYDMHGNVWEWVQDYYSTNAYLANLQVDPTGPLTGIERVVRGGSWHLTATDWRSAFKKGYEQDYRGISIGFRVVLESE